MTKRTLGSVVKEARDEARMTQRELATAVGIKASHIAYIENGRRRPSISLINRLGETLGLDAKEQQIVQDQGNEFHFRSSARRELQRAPATL